MTAAAAGACRRASYGEGEEGEEREEGEESGSSKKAEGSKRRNLAEKEKRSK
jgi:hypothetical protein